MTTSTTITITTTTTTTTTTTNDYNNDNNDNDNEHDDNTNTTVSAIGSLPWQDSVSWGRIGTAGSLTCPQRITSFTLVAILLTITRLNYSNRWIPAYNIDYAKTCYIQGQLDL